MARRAAGIVSHWCGRTSPLETSTDQENSESSATATQHRHETLTTHTAIADQWAEVPDQIACGQGCGREALGL